MLFLVPLPTVHGTYSYAPAQRDLKCPFFGGNIQKEGSRLNHARESSHSTTRMRVMCKFS
jgi:hypothetical protein